VALLKLSVVHWKFGTSREIKTKTTSPKEYISKLLSEVTILTSTSPETMDIILLLLNQATQRKAGQS